MSQEARQTELQAQTQQLLSGPLKHIRAAALAAALLPLASVAAAPAAAQEVCPSGGAFTGTICGVIFNDVNGSDTFDEGDTVLENAYVYVSDGTETIELRTDEYGLYSVDGLEGTWTVSVLIPTGMQVSDPNVGGDDTVDSDGAQQGPYSVVSDVQAGSATDFGFTTPPIVGLGTGTPGYWKNHPEAWPVDSIVVGGVLYSKADAIYWLGKVGKDKRTTMFSSLVPAMLNVHPLIGNANCVADEIRLANEWMAFYGPLDRNVPGVPVAGSSAAWKMGEPWHMTMDAYNNGRLCAPHRQ